jgi:hypothetical protein
MVLYNEKYNYDNNKTTLDHLIEELNDSHSNILKEIFDKLKKIIDEISANPPPVNPATPAITGGNIVKRKTRKHRNH